VIAHACKGPSFKVVVEKSTVPVKTAEAIAKASNVVHLYYSTKSGFA
jgi:UDP-glucose 6-dehydrogenase